jgi:iron complex transport system permease protein
VRARAISIGLIVLIGAMLISGLIGVAGLPASDAFREVLSRLPGGPDSPLDELEKSLLWQIRFPRIVLAVFVGAALGMCGCAYQGAFRNPLVDPYLLGSAAGAGLGATIAFVYLPGVSDWPIDPLPLFAFVGALVAVAISYGIGAAAASRADRRDASVLVLAGVAVASFFTAVQTLVQQRGSDNLQQVYSWLLGGLVTSGWGDVLLVLPYLLVSSVVILLSARLLDVLAVGDDEARTLGVRPERIRFAVVLAASLGTAAAVAVSGLIGFVGLVVPHVVRLLVGSGHTVTLPTSALFGGAFLALCDLGARTLLAPAELPLGVITAFIGAPFFASLLLRRGRS